MPESIDALTDEVIDDPFVVFTKDIDELEAWYEHVAPRIKYLPVVSAVHAMHVLSSGNVQPSTFNKIITETRLLDKHGDNSQSTSMSEAAEQIRAFYDGSEMEDTDEDDT